MGKSKLQKKQYEIVIDYNEFIRLWEQIQNQNPNKPFNEIFNNFIKDGKYINLFIEEINKKTNDNFKRGPKIAGNLNIGDLIKFVSSIDTTKIPAYSLPLPTSSIRRSGRVFFDEFNICKWTYDKFIDNINKYKDEDKISNNNIDYINSKQNKIILYITKKEVVTTSTVYVDNVGLLNNNLKLFDKLSKITNKEAPELIIPLRIDVYYVFLISLFIYDPYHDFRNGFRNKTTCLSVDKKTQNTYKKDCQSYLQSKLDLILEEWTDLNTSLGLNNSGLSYIKPDNIFNLLTSAAFETNMMSKLRSLLNIIKTSSPNSRENSIEIYNDTQKKLTSNSKFVSNNALMLLNDESIFLETEYNVAQYPFLFNINYNITNFCKTLPASLYDGAGGKCGSIKSCIENSSGYEFSNYNIKFVIKEMQNNNNSPYLILKSIYTSEDILPDINVIERNQIYQEINIERKNNKGQLFNVKYKYEIINNKNTINNEITVDTELLPYFFTNVPLSYNNNNNIEIDEGDFGKIIKTQNPNCDIICLVRKGLCDFGQYFNGMLKYGGYITNSQDFNKIKDETDADYRLVLNDNTVVPYEDYPFISLHGDQPAAALNLFLLYGMEDENVNINSHTVYAGGKVKYIENMETQDMNVVGYNPSFAFCNRDGDILIVPNLSTVKFTAKTTKLKGYINTKKRKFPNSPNNLSNKKRIKGGGNYDIDIDIYTVLNEFFILSTIFKMPSENFQNFNDFCDKYYFDETFNVESLNDENEYLDFENSLLKIKLDVDDVKEKNQNLSSISNSTNATSSTNETNTQLSDYDYRSDITNNNPIQVGVYGGEKVYEYKSKSRKRKYNKTIKKNRNQNKNKLAKTIKRKKTKIPKKTIKRRINKKISTRNTKKNKT